MNKLTIKEKLGYGAASAGDSIAYSLIGSFLMFFLTTVAGIDPGIAGIISATGSVWNAMCNPVMGFLSDGIRSKMGKRRPMMLAFSIPLALTMLLLFTDVNLPQGIKSVYYGVMLMMFWTSYAGYFVPYMALGAAYTGDYDDRTVLRLFASLFNMAGNLLSMFAPTMLVEIMVNRGLSTETAWTAVGGILGALAAATIIITFFASKKKDSPYSEVTSGVRRSFDLRRIMAEYISVVRLKPIRHLVIASLSLLCAYSMIMADMMYFFTFCMGYSGSRITVLLVARSFMGALMIPVSARLTAAIDKRGAIILLYAAGAVIMTALRFFGIGEGPSMWLYLTGLTFTTVIYWQLMPSIYYDVCEYDRYATGRARQGTIVSFQGLVEALAVGLGTLILGRILRFAGFVSHAAVQSDYAQEWILKCTTVVPLIFIFIGCIAIYRYPLTREAYRRILDELTKRDALEDGDLSCDEPAKCD